MDDCRKKIHARLKRVWEKPNLRKLFEIVKRQTPRQMREGTILFNEGGPVGPLYLILEGYVKIYRLSEEGKETTNYLLGPGNVIGIRTLLSKDETSSHTAEALTPIKILTISREECFAAIEENPDLLIDFLHIFDHRLSYTERKYESFIYASTTARVAIFLSDCAMRFGIKKNRKIEIGIELTHQRIAEFVGAFRETVTLSLHRLEEEGIIHIERGRVTVLNLAKLQHYAMFGKKR
jgi:CRP/FNR family transcriptional regulator